MTYTFATLYVSATAYDEIAGKLRAAGYDHAFGHADGAIDMHGIGLTREPEPALPADVIKAAATAIANARGNRRGVPDIKNILDVLPAKLRDEVMEDAQAALEAATALESLASRAEGEWRSIDSAPKDGTRLLAIGGEVLKHVTIVWWDQKVGAWDADHTMLEDFDVTERPTHWQPLPAPPAREGGAS